MICAPSSPPPLAAPDNSKFIPPRRWINCPGSQLDDFKGGKPRVAEVEQGKLKEKVNSVVLPESDYNWRFGVLACFPEG
ncbi:uncharacterized protein [Lolium perenne]|uniref:uncharacterized protein isoform X2 n=1 Tax=Lolium perenne TaxID=4522 RepID=UPI003A9A19CF